MLIKNFKTNKTSRNKLFITKLSQELTQNIYSNFYKMPTLDPSENIEARITLKTPQLSIINKRF